MTTLLHARVDKLLVNVSQKRKPEGYVSEDILTFVSASKDSGLIGKYGLNNFRIEHDIVGGETPYPVVTSSTKSSDRYLIQKHGLSIVVTEEDFDNEEQPFDARKDAVDDLTDKLWLGKEKSLADTLTDTSVLIQNVTLSGTDQYNNYANSDPLGDWNLARATIRSGSGQIVDGPAGFAIMPWEVFNVLKFHTALIENIKYTSSTNEGLTADQMKKVMGVGRLLIPTAEYNNSKEGQSDNMTPVWGKHIVFGYAPRTGTKRMKTLGFRVQKRKARRVFVDKIKNPPNAEEIKIDDSYDMLLTDVLTAYLIKDAIA